MHHTKNKTKILYSIIIILLTASCTNTISDNNDTIIAPISKTPICFTLHISNTHSTTRMDGESFEENDTIGIYAVKELNSFNNEKHINNKHLIFNGIELTPEENLYYPDGSSSCKFFSYYPYQKNKNNESNSNISAGVESDQSNYNNYSKSDFMTARTELLYPSRNSINLDFFHRFSQININIKAESQKSLEDLKNNSTIAINNIFTKCSYNFDNDEVSNLDALNSIKPYGEWEIETTNLLLFGKKAILIPQTCSNSQIVLQVNNRTFICNFPVNTNLSGGVSYDITLKYDSQVGIEGVTQKINDWIINEEKYEWDLSEKTQQHSIAINTLDFNISSIYQVASTSGTIIGNICKEYLLNETIDAVAIVYYSLTDPLNGTVLQILDNTDAVHGGKVVWSGSNNSFTYQAGSKQPIANLYTDEQGYFIPTPIEESPNIIAKAYYLIDQRGNEINNYPIVKIGKQYWMREDLKTLYYTDNTILANNSSNLSSTNAGYYTRNNCIFYNKAVIVSDKIAPIGWSIPSYDQWEALKSYINNESAKLKMGDDWNSNDGIASANNITGFGGLPKGGFYKATIPTEFMGLNDYAFYWRMSNSDSLIPYDAGIALNAKANEVKGIPFNDACAFLIRCIKNE